MFVDLASRVRFSAYSVRRLGNSGIKVWASSVFKRSGRPQNCEIGGVGIGIEVLGVWSLGWA